METYQEGVTLIELLITVAVVGLLSLVVTAFFVRGITSFRQTAGQVQALENARGTLKHIREEVRNASSVGSNNWLTQFSDYDVTFTSNIDADEDTETVRYYLDNTTLFKQIDGSPAQAVLFNVQNKVKEKPLFAIDTDTSLNAMSLHLTVLVDADPEQYPDAVELSTQATPRQALTYVIDQNVAPSPSSNPSTGPVYATLGVGAVGVDHVSVHPGAQLDLVWVLAPVEENSCVASVVYYDDNQHVVSNSYLWSGKKDALGQETIGPITHLEGASDENTNVLVIQCKLLPGYKSHDFDPNYIEARLWITLS